MKRVYNTSLRALILMIFISLLVIILQLVVTLHVDLTKHVILIVTLLSTTTILLSGWIFLFVRYIYIPIFNIERVIQKELILNESIYEDEQLGQQRVRVDNAVEQLISKQQQQFQREIRLELLYRNAQLSALQSQINPHFLYNTLESIRGLALTEGIVEIAEMIKALSKLFRNNIKKQGALITLAEELENIENYMKIQNFRFNNRFDFNLKLNSDERVLSSKILNFSVQPIIENAIFHGLETKQGVGTIEMEISSSGKFLFITITDNGLGMEPKRVEVMNEILIQDSIVNESQQDESYDGIGLININKRIKLQFGVEYGIIVSSTPNVGTQIELKLPLILD